jgi:hypothetical protein
VVGHRAAARPRNLYKRRADVVFAIHIYIAVVYPWRFPATIVAPLVLRFGIHQE